MWTVVFESTDSARSQPSANFIQSHLRASPRIVSCRALFPGWGEASNSLRVDCASCGAARPETNNAKLIKLLNAHRCISSGQIYRRRMERNMVAVDDGRFSADDQTPLIVLLSQRITQTFVDKVSRPRHIGSLVDGTIPSALRHMPHNGPI